MQAVKPVNGRIHGQKPAVANRSYRAVLRSGVPAKTGAHDNHAYKGATFDKSASRNTPTLAPCVASAAADVIPAVTPTKKIAKAPAPTMDTELLQRLYNYACLSKAAYYSPEQKALDAMSKWVPGFGPTIGQLQSITDSKPLIGNLAKTDTQVLVCMRDCGELIFAFRGTESQSDAVTDVVFRPVPVAKLAGLSTVQTKSDVKVHRGFLTSFNDVAAPQTGELDLKQVALSLAEKQGKPVTRITCCGHSLGGALATLAAYWCKKYGFPQVPVTCVTFGSPRVGNKQFVDEFKALVEESYRFQNKRDIVPTVPPFWFGFRHVGTDVVLCQPLVEDFGLCAGKKEALFGGVANKEEFAAFVADRPMGKLYASAPDHFMVPGYLKAMSAILKVTPPTETKAAQQEEAQSGGLSLAARVEEVAGGVPPPGVEINPQDKGVAAAALDAAAVAAAVASPAAAADTTAKDVVAAAAVPPAAAPSTSAEQPIGNFFSNLVASFKKILPKA